MTANTRWRRIAHALLIAVLLLRLLLFMRAAAWEPTHMVGDFATDYYPRAEFIANHGWPPTASELATDLYLRPPGTSALLALPIAAGNDWEGVVRANRSFNLLVESLLLYAMLLILMRWTGAGWHLLPLGGLLLAQPWTAGFALLPGSDTLNMALLAASACALVICLQQLRAHQPFRFAAWIVGLGLAGSLLLRAESVLWLPLLGLATLWCWRIAPDRRRSLLAPMWAPVLAALLICVGYSQFVRGQPNLWRADHSSFSENGVNRWVRTWYGSEQAKTNIAFYWFRGQHLDMETVPAIAIRNPEQALRIGALLDAAVPGQPLSANAQSEFADLARENRGAAPFDYFVGIPFDHLFQMLTNASAFPESARLLGRAKPGLGRLLAPALLWMVVLGCLLCCWPAPRVIGVSAWMDFRVVALVLVVTRLGLFAVLLNYPENRYLLPCWPLLLTLAALGWSRLLLSETDARGSLTVATR